CFFWDSDRQAYIEDLGARLARDPHRIAGALKQTKQGVEWILENWSGLSDSLSTNGRWNDDQRSLALDLLGVAPVHRDGTTRVPPDADAATLAALVEAEIDRLHDRLESGLLNLDEAERAMAAAGMPTEEDAQTRRLRRYEAAARRALNSAKTELLR